MNTTNILIIVIVIGGLGMLLVIYNLLKKGGKLLKKLPTNFLLFFLIFGILGLTGFLSNEGVATNPMLLAILLIIASLTSGMIMTDRLFEKWEWSKNLPFWRKALYLLGIILTSIISFAFIFLICEYRGFPEKWIGLDVVWPFSALFFLMMLPLLLKHLHLMWNEIPKINQVIPIFTLPEGKPKMVETGGISTTFFFNISRDFNSNEILELKVVVPLNKKIEEAFHWALHEHNIIDRNPKKILIAEDNKKSKKYAWSFYREKKIWWGWWIKKLFLEPSSKVGGTIANGEFINVQREKIWEQ